MEIVKATVRLYREALADTWRSLGRSAWAIAYLLAANVGFYALAVALSGTGMAGGFVLGFVQAGLIGWYLAQLDVAVVSRRKLRLDDLRDGFGSYFWETISVLFLFFVPELMLQLSVPQVLPFVVPLAAIAFNPAPEALYQDRTQSVQLLGDALRFMQHNWPEWLAPHLVAVGVLMAWGWAVTGVLHQTWWVEVVQTFGPFCGFITPGTLALRLGGVGPAGVLSFFGVLLFVHAFMLFRGHLYRRLRSTSRRGRSWQARL